MNHQHNHHSLILKTWRAILALAGIFFGFHATVAAQYGAIETSFRINGHVASQTCNIPLERIKVRVQELDDKEDTYPYEHSTITDSNGNFSFELGHYYRKGNFRILAAAPNGSYKDTAFIIPASMDDFKRTQPGHWEIAYEYKSPLMVLLPESGIPPCVSQHGPFKMTVLPEMPIAEKTDTGLIRILTDENRAWTPEPTEASLPRPGLKVFPNPSNGHLTAEIESISEIDGCWFLFDDRSRLLISKALHLNKGLNRFTVEMTQFPAGNYLLKVSGEGISCSSRLVNIK